MMNIGGKFVEIHPLCKEIVQLLADRQWPDGRWMTYKHGASDAYCWQKQKND